MPESQHKVIVLVTHKQATTESEILAALQRDLRGIELRSLSGTKVIGKIDDIEVYVL